MARRQSCYYWSYRVNRVGCYAGVPCIPVQSWETVRAPRVKRRPDSVPRLDRGYALWIVRLLSMRMTTFWASKMVGNSMKISHCNFHWNTSRFQTLKRSVHHTHFWVIIWCFWNFQMRTLFKVCFIIWHLISWLLATNALKLQQWCDTYIIDILLYDVVVREIHGPEDLKLTHATWAS